MTKDLAVEEEFQLFLSVEEESRIATRRAGFGGGNVSEYDLRISALLLHTTLSEDGSKRRDPERPSVHAYHIQYYIICHIISILYSRLRYV